MIKIKEEEGYIELDSELWQKSRSEVKSIVSKYLLKANQPNKFTEFVGVNLFQLLLEILRLSPQFFWRSERFVKDIMPQLKLLLLGTDLKTQTSLSVAELGLQIYQEYVGVQMGLPGAETSEETAGFSEAFYQMKRLLLQKVTKDLLSSEVCMRKIERIKTMELTVTPK